MARDTYTTKFTTEGLKETLRDIEAIAKSVDTLKEAWSKPSKSNFYAGYTSSPASQSQSYDIKSAFITIDKAVIKIGDKDFSEPIVKTLDKGFKELVGITKAQNNPLAKIAGGFLSGIGLGVSGTYTNRATNRFLDKNPALEDPVESIKTASKALSSIKRAFEFVLDPLKAAAKYGEDIETIAKQTNEDLREAFAFLRSNKMGQVKNSVRRSRTQSARENLNLTDQQINEINQSPSINLVAGGLAQTGGEDSAKTAKGLAILFKKLGVKESAVIPVANTFSDRLPVKLPDPLQGKEFTEETEKIATLARNYAQAVFENVLLGYNPDAVAMAAKAMAYRKQFPDKPINLSGYSGGGNIAAEALAILKKAGVDNVKGVGIGSPQTGILFDQDKDYSNLVGIDDAIRFPVLDLLGNSQRNKDVAGGKNHELREYIRNKDFQKAFAEEFERQIKNTQSNQPSARSTPVVTADPIAAFKGKNDLLKGETGLGKKFQDAIANGDNKLAQELGDRIIKTTDQAYALFEKIPQAQRDKSIKGIKGSLESRRSQTVFELSGLPPSIGKNIEAGFKLGADGKPQGKEFAKDVIDGAEDVLGIQSPSKVFQRIGKYIVEGLEIGLTGFDGALEERKNILELYVKSVIDLMYDFKKVTAQIETPAQEVRKLFQDISASQKVSTEQLKKAAEYFPKLNFRASRNEDGGSYSDTDNRIDIAKDGGFATSQNKLAEIFVHEYTHALQSAFGKAIKEEFDSISPKGQMILDLEPKLIEESAKGSFNSMAKDVNPLLRPLWKYANQDVIYREEEAYSNQYALKDELNRRGYLKADAASKVPLYKAVKRNFRESGGTGGFGNYLNSQYEDIDGLASKLGVNVQSGFASGANGKAQGKKLGRDIIDGAEEELEIKSPSKVFQRIGRFVIEGFKNGIGNAKNLPDAFENWVQKIEAQFGKLPTVVKNGFKFLQPLLAGFLVGQGIQTAIGWIKQLRDAASEVTLRFEQMEKAFAFSTSENAVERLSALRQQSQKRGVDFETSLEAQTGLNFATKGTALEGSVSDDIFNAVADTSAVRGFDKDQQKALFQTFTTLADRSEITFRELVSTVNNLPGGLQIAARALGVTDLQLKKMAESGQLVSADFLPKFIAQLNAENAGGLVGASNTAQAAVARFNNSFTEFLNLFGKAKQPIETAGFNAASAAIDTLNKSIGGILKTAALFGAANFIVSIGVISRIKDAVLFLAAATLNATKAIFGASVATGFWSKALTVLGLIIKSVGAFFTSFFATLLKQLALAYVATEVWTKVFEGLDTSGDKFASLTNEIEKNLNKLDNKFDSSKEKVEDWRDSIIKALRGDQKPEDPNQNFFQNPFKGITLPGSSFLSSNLNPLKNLTTYEETDKAIFEEKIAQAISQKNRFENDAKLIPVLVKQQQELDTQLNLERLKRAPGGSILAGDAKGLADSVAREKDLLDKYNNVSKDISTRRTNLELSISALKQLQQNVTNDATKNLLQSAIDGLGKTKDAMSKLLAETATGLAGVTKTVNDLQGSIEALNRGIDAKKTEASIAIANEGLGVGNSIVTNSKPFSAYPSTSEYGQRWGRLHKGLDSATPIGTPISYMENSKVVDSGTEKDYGNFVEIETQSGLRIFFAHLSEILVKKGDQIAAGQLIAKTGNTGRSTGPHLHTEVRYGDDGKPFNPREKQSELDKIRLGGNVSAITQNASIDSLRRAIIGQESGGNFKAVNTKSGALGYGQVMPENVASWTKQALGKSLTTDQFLSNPNAQITTINTKLNEYLDKELKASKGDINLAIRKVASLWYSGRADKYDDPTPQFYGGEEYPSIREYTKSILTKYRQEASKGGQKSTATINQTQEEANLRLEQEKSAEYQKRIAEARKKIDSFGSAQSDLADLGINIDDVGQDLTSSKGTPRYDGLIKAVEDYRKVLIESKNIQNTVVQAQVKQRDTILQNAESLIKQANEGDLQKAQNLLKIGLANYDEALARTQDPITRQYIESSKEGFQNSRQFAIDRTANEQKYNLAKNALPVPGIDKAEELRQIKDEGTAIKTNYELAEKIRKSKLEKLKIDNNITLANERREQLQQLSVESQKLENDKKLRDFDNKIRDAKTPYNPEQVANERKYLEETNRLDTEQLRLKIAIANAEEKLRQQKLKGLTTGVDEQKNIDSLNKQLAFIADQVKDAQVNLEIGTKNTAINQLIKQLQNGATLVNLLGEISNELANRQERQGGDLFGANAIRLAAERLKIQSETNLKVQELKRLQADPKLAGEAGYIGEEGLKRLQETIDKTEELGKLKLEGLATQFKDLGATIADNADQAFGEFFDNIFDGTKGIGDAFNDMAVSILKSLAKIASDGFFSNLKNLLGLGDSPVAGFGGIVGGSSPAESFNFGTAIPSLLGFDDGGYTGLGGKKEIAGIVHKGEMVFSQRNVSDIGLNYLSNLRNSGKPKMPNLSNFARGNNTQSYESAPTVNTYNTFNIPNTDSLRKTSSQLAIEQAEANRRAMKYQ